MVLNKEQFQAKMAEGREARVFAKKIIDKHGDKEKEFTVGGEWQTNTANQLKEKSIVFIGNALKYFAQAEMNPFGEWLTENLKTEILNKYNNGSETDKAAFKKKMTEFYPEIKLTKEL